MGDARYDRVLRRLQEAPDRSQAIRAFADDELVQALAALSAWPERHDPLLANVLATEASNRIRRNSAIVELAGEGILVLDADGAVVFANPALESLLGYAADELRGRDPHETVHRDLRDEHYADVTKCSLLRALQTSRPGVIEESLLAKDGRQVPVSLTCSPIVREGEVDGVIVLVRDLTARREAERRRAARHRILEIFAQSPPLEAVAGSLLEIIGHGFGWDVGAFWVEAPGGDGVRCIAYWSARPGATPAFEAATLGRELASGEGIPGRIWRDGAPFWGMDITSLARDAFPRILAARADGLHAVFAFPAPVAKIPQAVLEFYASGARVPDEALVSSAESLGAEIGGFVERLATQRRLRDSEARKASMLQAALDAVVTIDEGSLVVEFNPAAERMFGYAREEIVGKDLYDTIVPEAYRERHRRGMARYRATGEGPILGRLLELPARRKDGTQIMTELYIVPFQVGGRTFFTSGMRDVTERKRAEAARAHLAALVDSSQDAIIGKSLDGTIVSWNEGARRLYGYTRDEAVGRSIKMIAPPELHSEIDEILAKLRRGERVDHDETRRIAKDGRVLDVSLTVSPIRGPDGEIIGASAVARDITARKRVERELREAEARMRLAVEATGLGMWEWSPDTGEVVLSARSREIFGFTPGEVVAYESLLARIHPEDRGAVRQSGRGAFASQGPAAYVIEYRVILPDGSLRRVRSSVQAARGDDRWRLFGTHLDVTEATSMAVPEGT